MDYEKLRGEISTNTPRASLINLKNPTEGSLLGLLGTPPVCLEKNLLDTPGEVANASTLKNAGRIRGFPRFGGVLSFEHNLIPFQFESNPIRVITADNGEAWFIAKEIADVLGYSDAFEMTKKLDDDEKQNLQIAGGLQPRQRA